MTGKIDALISVLKVHTDPMSVGEIKAALKEEIPERTLRRWLKVLVDEGVVLALGQYKARRYQLNSIVIQSHPSPFFSEHSLLVLQAVERPIFEREPCAYHEAWLKQYIPNESFYLTQAEREILAQNSLLPFEEGIANTYARKIFNRLLIDLSYNSSRLEGNTYTLIETQKLILEGKVPLDKLDVEKLMILNHKQAIQFLVDRIGRIKVDLNSIRTMHYLLADGLILADDAGQIRKESVRISLSTYILVEGEKRLLQLLECIVETASKIRDPFEQSFFLLVHIAYLQPFIDVNKRTARLCSNIPLIKNSLIPLSFNDVDKDEYISSMIAIYEYNDTRPLAELYIWSYLRSCQQYQALSVEVGIDMIHVRYRQLQRKLIAKMIQEKITGTAIKVAIQEFARKNVPDEDQEAFIDNTQHQVDTLEEYKIVGMGISVQEFLAWRKNKK
ncbi:MAG: hypothetical protein K0R48_57 [Gammaproteobacteria bacterium]|nr:hypothetical protein [Gammaproteobacteria bacterium]